MAREGSFNGFYFDKEVFTDYMQEQSCLNNLIIASGILQHDTVMDTMVRSQNNVGTIPMFRNVDDEPDAKNYDGKTDNTPNPLTGKKQTFMAVSRMQSWCQTDYVRYLTGTSPLQNLANNLLVPYFTNQWEKVILSIIKGIMGLSSMETHQTKLATTTGEITAANKVALTTHIDLGQKAIGDKRENFALFIAHSQVIANYKKLELIENVKYYSDILGREISVSRIGSMIVLETDTGTVDNTVEGYPVYHSYMVGRGQILTCPKDVPVPYDTTRDPEKYGGMEAIYAVQGKCFHPNGFSIKADNIAAESPLNSELANSENWELRVNHKQITIAEIISNG